MLWIYHQENITFIQELINVDKENIMDALERVLKREKEAHQEISTAHKKELDNRLESYKTTHRIY
ncbi:hypothetical protein SAMN04489761_3359 [Tenacibaculum sp. MAR_2009_124]|nr:hypothetical protein SAMN04489761_3359 [Tenacibaculum sp. MAR_2009_124]